MPKTGTIRIKTADLKVYKFNGKKWVITATSLTEAKNAIHLYKSHHNFKILIDQKNPEFLKGQLSKDGKIQGGRVNELPHGEKLTGAFSLFAKHLTIHDESSNEHWDVIYQNPNGKFTYLYTLKKKKKATKNKYKKVKEFEKIYEELIKNVEENLENEKDSMALPMFTLLKTLMRVGNEIYYKAHKHKGLTTLKKGDISIKGNIVTFQFLSKNGVPRKITQEFSKAYIKMLRKRLKGLKKENFVFSDSKGKPLKDFHFKKAFKKYCGKEFYPHIVRSYYATKKTEEFLAKNETRSKKEIKEFLFSIAEKLGHKKYSQKKHQWLDSYTVTVNHYIDPELVKKING